MKVQLIHYNPDPELSFESSLELAKYCDSLFEQIAQNQFVTAYKTNQPEIQTKYRQLYETAIELECEQEFMEKVKYYENLEEHLKFWALPKPLEHESSKYTFPVNSFPAPLREYLSAVSKYAQVPHDMCALPLLSTLATCAQGKARASDPQNGHTSELTLFTMTVAPSSARKSSSKEFFRPIEEYQRRYNEEHERERLNRKSEREVKQQQRAKALKQGQAEQVKRLDEELAKLPEIPKLLLKINDTTPEAMINVMNAHNGKIALLDQEGGVLSTIAKNYGGNTADVSIFCLGYDGDPYYNARVTTGEKDIQRPLITLGLLTQPKIFFDFIRNEEFQEKGFVNRFLFAFPEVKQGTKQWSDYRIPEAATEAYTSIINKLLSMPESTIPVKHSRTSAAIFRDYFEDIQRKEQSGGIFEHIANYAEKQYTIGLKIATLLHLCEHEPSELISEFTAQQAVNIMMWAQNQALKAFSGEVGEDPLIVMAYQIIDKLLKKRKGQVLRYGRAEKGSTYSQRKSAESNNIL